MEIQASESSPDVNGKALSVYCRIPTHPVQNASILVSPAKRLDARSERTRQIEDVLRDVG